MKRNIKFASLGNGYSVYNCNKEVNNDYEHIAHIDYNRTVKYYVNDLSKEDRLLIENFAGTENGFISATQPEWVLQPLNNKFEYDYLVSSLDSHCFSNYDLKNIGYRIKKLEELLHKTSNHEQDLLV